MISRLRLIRFSPHAVYQRLSIGSDNILNNNECYVENSIKYILIVKYTYWETKDFPYNFLKNEPVFPVLRFL